MKQDESKSDKHMEAPSESKQEKHNNFQIEKESTENVSLNKGSSERQKQWQQEIEEGEQEKRSNNPDNSQMPLDEDDTMGIP